MDFNSVKIEMEDKMHSSIEALKKEFSSLRTGRASSNILDNVVVMAYGQATPLNQVASVSVPDSRLIAITVWDKGNVLAVDKAIREANLGLNPAVDGTLIRIPIPPLSEERRLELIKIAKQYSENFKVAVRNIRRDYMEDVKKAGKNKEITEDEQKDYEEKIQKSTDNFIAEIDKVLANKEKDIMQV
jgi:ribosome recycling factor